jgi:hypothetical protein
MLGEVRASFSASLEKQLWNACSFLVFVVLIIVSATASKTAQTLQEVRRLIPMDPMTPTVACLIRPLQSNQLEHSATTNDNSIVSSASGENNNRSYTSLLSFFCLLSGLGVLDCQPPS